MPKILASPNPIARRIRVRRTAWALAGCALLSYAAFLYSMITP